MTKETFIQHTSVFFYITGAFVWFILGLGFSIILSWLLYHLIKSVSYNIYTRKIWPLIKKFRFVQYLDFKRFQRRYIVKRTPITYEAGELLYTWQTRHSRKDHYYHDNLMALLPKIFELNPEAEEGYKVAKFDAENEIN